MREPRQPRTFDSRRFGHRVKFVCGLVQHYGALTAEEIEVLLYSSNIESNGEDLRRILNCAIEFNWIIRRDVGLGVYYGARNNNMALHFQRRGPFRHINMMSWRADVRDFWRQHEPNRFRVISESLGAA